MREWRKMTWVVVVVNALMLLWVVSAAVGASQECEPGSDACQAGVAVGIGILVFFWAIVDVILGVVWMVTKPGQRD